MKDIFAEAINHYGPISQVSKAIEELSELIRALSRYQGDVSFSAEVCDEIADVEIMLTQMKYIFSQEEIEKRRTFKLQRLRNAIELGKMSI